MLESLNVHAIPVACVDVADLVFATAESVMEKPKIFLGRALPAEVVDMLR